MSGADAIVLDGFLEEETVPGDPHCSTAHFRLTVSPTDERTDEMILPCSVTDPQMAHQALHELTPGDQLRVTGYLRLPRTPDDPMSLVVTELVLLQPAPTFSNAFTSTLERYGPYTCYFDADTDQVPVWTETGAWVGVADTPAELAQLLEAFEQRHGAGGDQP
ncbi:hypothetical protein ACR31U_35275 (plasmid) [Streptomyces rochei]|uniref:hypothetical protein n=1 Tax=Streptomyces TaxID=1883 RepID=UPI0004CACA14|nr:hypothetical protein [Streptomyces sp. WAC05458]RSS15355.1 hypothetical protein EF914_29340 [Streptomyces sp. WAC05458]